MQGIRWLGLVFGFVSCVGAVRVLSKQARVWFGVGAKQG